jgi:hypothetical protein
MSAPKRSINVIRAYNPAPDACLRALTVLLKKPARKEGGPPTAPDNDAKESNND